MQLLSIPAGPEWLGNDGPWSSFQIGIGTPSQLIKLLPAISTNIINIISPQTCDSSDDQPFCQLASGGLFDNDTSTTWEFIGNYTSHTGTNLDLHTGIYGYDSIVLGASQSELEHQLLVSLNASEFALATLGLQSVAVSSVAVVNSSIPSTPSLLQNLKSTGLISSLSWGYTAGSFAVFQGSSQSGTHGHGSLTLGGYDAAYFEPNNLTFAINGSNGTTFQSFGVNVTAIQMLEGLGSVPLTFGAVKSANIDMSTNTFWLPQSMCDSIADFLNLTYNPGLHLYLINDTVHEALLSKNISMNFLISENSDNPESAATLPISMPYSSLALQLTNDWPGTPANFGTHTYFPMRRGAEQSAYLFGRAFFQNAYFLADYERSTFSVHQALFPSDGVQDLRTISPPSIGGNTTGSGSVTAPTDSASTGSAEKSTSTLSTAVIAGIVVGSIVLLVIALIIGYFTWRKRKRAMTTADIDKTELEDQPGLGRGELGSGPENVELHAEGPATSELRGNMDHPRELRGDISHPYELRSTHRPDELAAREVAKEMRAHIPSRHEMQA